MADSSGSFGYTVAIYAAVTLVVFILFSFWRRARLTRRFYAPKCYINPDMTKPNVLPPSFLGWIPKVISIDEDQIIRTAGIDAAMYLKTVRMGFELFLFLIIISCAIMLPICLTSDEVDKLMDDQATPAPPSNFTYWLSPPPPPNPPGQKGKTDDGETPNPPDDMYNKTLGKAPPGLEWWQYNEDVPPLPQPSDYGLPSTYGWKYDDTPTSVKDYYFTTLDKTTIANITPGDDKLYAPAVLMWVVTFFCFWHWWRYSQIASRLRMRYLLRVHAGAETRTVLCTDIPGIVAGTIPERLGNSILFKFIPASIKDAASKQLKRASSSSTSLITRTVSSQPSKSFSSTSTIICEGEDIASLEAPNRWEESYARQAANGGETGMVDCTFQTVFKEDFNKAHLCYNTGKLDKIVNTYNATLSSAEDLVDDYIGKKQRGEDLPEKKVTIIGAKSDAWTKEKFGLKPTKVDAFEYYADRLEYLKGEITKAQEEAKTQVYPSAFVTFNRRAPQVIASTALLSEDLSTWRCQAAPRPEEIVWKNIGMRSWERSLRVTLMWIAFALLAIFFFIPVTAVQALINSESVVGFIQDIPIASTFLTSILPSLALIIFLAILPMILAMMNKLAGALSEGEIDMGVITKFYYFQVITVFFGSFLAGSFASQLEQLINDPGSIVDVLGMGAPQTGLFFLSYTITKGLFTIPLGILRIVPLVLYKLKTKFAGTARAKERCWQNQDFTYGTTLPDDTMTVLFGLTFCVVSPLVVPAAAIYFGMQYLVRKYQLVHAFRAPYQTGGMAWIPVFNQCIVGLVIAQVVLIGLLGLKQIVAPPLIVLPLPFLTLAYCHIVHSTFWPSFKVNSLMAASDLDGYNHNLGASPSTKTLMDKEVANTYLSPSFAIDDNAYNQIVNGCRRLQQAVKGEPLDDAFVHSFDPSTDWDAMDDQFEALEKKATNGQEVVMDKVPSIAIRQTDEEMADAPEAFATPRGEV